ncbi:MAG TPA: hypothetical protein VN345_17355 [Blastocatellia bacterium]|jgi:hypothetical protein|nr:hypothetical protein [Blastocatellia bacterium]
MTTTLTEGSEPTGQASKLLRMPLRSPSPDEGAVDISQGPARVLTFPGATPAAAADTGRVGDNQNRNRYAGLTRSQKMQRIVSKVLSDELAEDKLGAILSRIEDITAAGGGN